MQLRPAQPSDLEICGSLDSSYTTDRVWQMQEREENGALTTTFRVVRLPREVKVDYPRQGHDLLIGWRQRDGFLVAEEEEGICGYVALTEQPEHSIARVGDLVVERRRRRCNIGTTLLQAAAQWARAQDLGRLVIEVQTKNYPAIQLSRSCGLNFCGYSDHYWPNQDIALFFGKSL